MLLCWRCCWLDDTWHSWLFLFIFFWFYCPIANCRSQRHDWWTTICDVDTWITAFSSHQTQQVFLFQHDRCQSLSISTNILIFRRWFDEICQLFFSSSEKWLGVRMRAVHKCDEPRNLHRKTFTKLHRNFRRSTSYWFSHWTWTWIFNSDRD